MKKKKQKPEQIRVRCQYCGRMARLHPASYVYGSNNLDSEVISMCATGIPMIVMRMWEHIKKSLLPKGELADGQLRNKRILAHRALNTLLKEGGMTRKSAYIWLQNKLCLQKKDMHIAKFSLYYCEETIRVCNELIEWHQKRKGE